MPKYSTAFGMDVHLRSTTVCALDADTGEAVTRRFPGNCVSSRGFEQKEHRKLSSLSIGSAHAF